MRLPSRLLSTLPLSALAMLAGSMGGGCQLNRSASDGVSVRIDDVPAEVRQTLEREAGGAKIESLVRTTEDGQEVYEAELTKNGRATELEILPTGLVYKVEEQMSPAELPDAVLDTVQREVPTGKITGVDREFQNGRTTYEIDVELQLHEWELVVMPDGTLVSKEVSTKDGKSTASDK